MVVLEPFAAAFVRASNQRSFPFEMGSFRIPPKHRAKAAQAQQNKRSVWAKSIRLPPENGFVRQLRKAASERHRLTVPRPIAIPRGLPATKADKIKFRMPRPANRPAKPTAPARTAAAPETIAPPLVTPPWLRPLIVLLAAALLFVWFSTEVADSDSWWHLKTGQYILQTHKLPVPDPFA